MKQIVIAVLWIAATRFCAGNEGLRTLAQRAAAGDASAVAQLREAGPAGLAVLIESYPTAAAAIDAVAKQKDASASRLYWYTDFEKAKAAARASGKPILSLRLLGNLDEEFSCANSRFFRTALYANAEVSRALQEHFVLHWKSVRPVPKITIDFGDGRTLERTITGNSIHYILDADGRVIDALPGLYGPKAFLRLLTGRVDHAAQIRAIDAALAADFAKLGLAHQRAEDLDDATWKKIAQLHADDAQLDAGSRALMRAKIEPAEAAMRRAISKTIVEDPLLRVVRSFEQSVSVDTVRNEYWLHRELHEWLVRTPAPKVDEFNERVYAELFLTPRSDPWLGLAPAEAYTALPENGLKRQ